MAQNLGQIRSAIRRVRQLCDLPEARAKYSDTDILGLLSEAHANVYQQLLNASDAIPLAEYTFSVVSTDVYVQFPPIVGSLVKIEILDTNSNVTGELLPSDILSPWLGGVVEGNRRFRIKGGDFTGSYRLLYIPSGECLMHVGRIPVTGASAAGFTMTDTTDIPLLVGEIDRRENAYCGAMIRILGHETATILPSGATQFPLMERVCQTYNYATGALTVSPSFPYDLSLITDGTEKYLTYEVYPLEAAAVWPLLALWVARHIALTETQSSKFALIDRQYQETRQTAIMRLSNQNLRQNQGWRKDSFDAREWHEGWL